MKKTRTSQKQTAKYSSASPSRKRREDPSFPYLDDEERELIESLERGEWVPSPNQEEHKRIAMQAAENYFKQKNARVNLRLTNGDLYLLKKRAEKEGMPYQTLIASVLHKYVTGQFG